MPGRADREGAVKKDPPLAQPSSPEVVTNTDGGGKRGEGKEAF